MRQTVAKMFYLVVVELISLYLVAFPVYAFQISSSSTGYVRVAPATSVASYWTAARVASAGNLAAVAATPTVVSTAIRLVTGPVGWSLLGVSAALTLAQMYYSYADMLAVKIASGTTTHTLTGWANPLTAAGPCAGASITCVSGTDYYIFSPNRGAGAEAPSCNLNPASPTFQANGGPQPPNYYTAWSGQGGSSGCYAFRAAGTPGAIPQAVALVDQQATVSNYLTGLAPANALSMETHQSPLGVGVSPTAATNVTSVSVAPTQVPTVTKTAATVLPTDSVINPNEPVPAAPQPVVTPSTSTTTTTTTVNNANGTVTKTEVESPATISCSAGTHDQRTFGAVLQDHMTLWQGSGLLSALNLLKTLTWPTTIPTYALNSTIMGNFTLDFSAWSGMLTALRSIIIAIAGFVAYRIVFVGSK